MPETTSARSGTAGCEFDSLRVVAAEDEFPLPDNLVSEKRRRQREVDEIDGAARRSFQRVSDQ